MNLEQTLESMGIRARAAARGLAVASASKKNEALRAIADALEAGTSGILEANARDRSAAEERGLSGAMVERLLLSEKRISDMANGVRNVAELPDPVGESLRKWEQPNGLGIEKIRVPIGVIGIIYESRPNVTSDAAVLCLKAGNAVILRGGSEAFHSNTAIEACLRAGLQHSGLPEDSIQLVPSPSREAVTLLAGMDRYIDLIIPRGGHALIETVVSQARMPVIKHFHGVCHVYVDAAADLDMAQRITVNAKCQRPGVCNAAETLLVHEAIARPFLEKCGAELIEKGVELRGDAATREILGEKVVAASEEDWTTEYLDLILAVRVVSNLEEAVDHMDRYGSHHSDAIVTSDPAAAERFLNEVDSATVYWNASTRFTDGGEFGFGAEIGISTDKLHARGPMGLEELTSYKYLIRGTGQIR